MRHRPFSLTILAASLAFTAAAHADGGSTATFRVTGLFSKAREPDLHQIVNSIAPLKITSIDFARGEVAFTYDPTAPPFKNLDQNKLVESIDKLLKHGSNHTFAALLPSDIPTEKLTRIEIPVAGIDCKACSYAAYRAIYQLDGVARATASFKDRLVTALVEPDKTDRATLEEALKRRGIEMLTTPEGIED